MEIVLIRHGRPLAQREARAGAGADPPLTDRGRAEAALLGAHLASAHGPTPDAVWTSPMRRARETAAGITARLDVPLRVDDRLREFDHGAAGYTPPELITASPAERHALWLALETGEWGAHRFDPDAFAERVEAAFADVVDAHPSGVVAVVCHSGVINSYLGGVLRRPRGMFFQPDYTSLSRLAVSRDGRRQVLSLNETAHLLPGGAQPRPLA